MKLIDILVDAGDETPLFGVHTKYLAMDPDGRVHGYCEMPSPTALGWGVPDALYSTDGRGCLIQIDRDDVDGQWQSAIITREQYEAALAAKNDGWIDWGGGKHPPVSTNTVVDVKLEKGYVQSGYPAGEYSWEHVWQGSNIIAYRLHQPQEAEQAKADDEADLNECIGQDATPVWNGEGQPPVGVECEYSWAGEPWASGVIRYISKHTIIIETQADSTGDTECAYHPTDIKLRPFRTEADRKRDEVVQALCNAGWGSGRVDEKSGYGSCWFDIYDAIAAGKIPGVRLDN